MTSKFVELERVVKEYRFKGVEIGSSIEGELLSHPKFRPVLKTIEQLGCFVFAHPYTCAATGGMEGYELPNTKLALTLCQMASFRANGALYDGAGVERRLHLALVVGLHERLQAELDGPARGLVQLGHQRPLLHRQQHGCAVEQIDDRKLAQRRLVFDYVVEEVLAALSHDDRDAALLLSLLDDLDPRRDPVVGKAGAAADADSVAGHWGPYGVLRGGYGRAPWLDRQTAEARLWALPVVR